MTSGPEHYDSARAGTERAEALARGVESEGVAAMVTATVALTEAVLALVAATARPHQDSREWAHRLGGGPDRPAR